MFRDFPYYHYYSTENDNDLYFLYKRNIAESGSKTKPEALTSRNIIFTPRGIREIANYYKTKYNIDIDIIVGTKETQSRQLKEFVEKAQLEASKEKDPSKLIKRGIIFFNYDAGQHGHASTIIWEKNSEKQRLYFFSGFWYSEYQNMSEDKLKEKPHSWNLKNELSSMLPEIELWADGGQGYQLDFSSCTIIALSQAKDCLRMKDSLFDTIKKRNKYIKKISDINFYYAPEELLKASQIESSVSETNPDVKETIHIHRVKDSKGELTGEEKPVSLEDFRADYAVRTFSHPDKLFGSYTLHKGKRYKKLIEDKWKKNRDKIVPEMLEMLAKTKADFDKAGSNTAHSSETPGNRFLDILRDDKSDLELTKETFKTICSAILIAQKPSLDFKVSPACSKNAIATEKLLYMLLLDKTQPAILHHFEKFLDRIKYFVLDKEIYDYGKKMMEEVISLKGDNLPKPKNF